MTKGSALYSFFNQFGIPFYPSTSVPKEANTPYGTYSPVLDAWESGQVSIPVNLWYTTEGEAEPNAKAQEISKVIGIGGKLLECDGGYIWVQRGTPFCQPMMDDSNQNIKRRYINIIVEYLTKD